MKIRSMIDSVKRRGAVTVRRACIETLEDRRLLSFSPAVYYAAGDAPQAVLTADFNNDTRLDLAVANYSSNNVSVLLGNGNGTFQAAVNSDTATNPLSVAVGDFNADGKLDLVTANAGNASVLLGNGNGTFQAPNNIAIGSNPTSVAVGDFNGDGKLDFAVTSNVFVDDGRGYYGGYYYHYEGSASVLLGNGAGSFAAPNTRLLGYGNHTSAAAEDFNGDGIDDFVTLNTSYGLATVLLGTATGTLGAPASFATGWYPLAITVGDFTGDGILDLATVGQTIDILPGYGDGTFRQVVRQYIDPVAVAPADFNGDGKLDLVTVEGNNLNMLLGLGNGTLTLPLNHTVAASPVAVATGDFNADGRPDVVSANSGSDNVSVLLNDGNWPALSAPAITISDVTVTEGNSGTTNATFTVSLSAASSQAVSIDYATTGGSAVAGSDYQSTSGTVTIPAGQTSRSVTVLVNGDRLAESSEAFSLLLSNPVNAFIADATGLGTITDDEPRVSIDYGPVWVAEGNSGTTNAVFTVRLAVAYDMPVTVNFSTVEGDTDFPAGGYWGYYGYYAPPPAATSNVDFQSQAGTVTFAPGQTVMTIPIAVYGDRIGESGEYFSVNLGTSPSGAMIERSHAVGVIADDEPSASINGASVTEGNTGTTVMNFTVSLSAAPTAPVTVDYATADGNATVADGDYQAKTGTLTFGIGETSKTLSVLVNGDRLAEYDEYFHVSLTGAVGAVVSSYSAYGQVIDNEPRLSINSVSVTEGNSGTKLMTFTVSLAAVYDQTVTVNYATQDSSATVAGNDYLAASGTLTFAPGQMTRTFTVTIRGDTQKEADESFNVLLSGASSNTVISNAYGWGTILNDDTKPGNRKKR